MSILWRTHEDKPDTEEPITALLCGPDEEGDGGHPPFLYGIYLWKRGKWLDEISGAVAKAPYWWVPEGELVSDLPRSSESASARGK